MRAHDSTHKYHSTLSVYVLVIFIGLEVGCSTTDEPAECRDLAVEAIDMLKPTPLGPSAHELQMQISGSYTEMLRWNNDATKTMLSVEVSGQSDLSAKLITMGFETASQEEDHCPKFRVVIPANIVIQTDDGRLEASVSGEFEFYSNDVAELVPQTVHIRNSESMTPGELHLSVVQDRVAGAIYERLGSTHGEAVSNGSRLIAEFGDGEWP